MRGMFLACLALLGAMHIPAQAAPVFRTVAMKVEASAFAFDNGWGMVFLPDGRALVTEKPGRIRILTIDIDASTGARTARVSAPLPNVPAVRFDGQNGLLDIGINGGFKTNRLVYFTYMEPVGSSDSRLALAYGKFVNDTLSDVRVIWRASRATTGGHPGGRMVFPGDSSIFLTHGDRQQAEPSQDPGQSLGKVIRLRLTGSPRSDNPFVGQAGWLPEIYSLGHRNPYGLAWDPVRKLLWEHEMGPARGDEVNIVLPGRNYGWPRVSNGSNYDGSNIPDHAPGDGFEAPSYAWSSETIAPSGLVVYRRSLFPGWSGSLLLGGLASQALIRLSVSGTTVTGVERFAAGHRIREVEEAPDGSLYLIADGGGGKLLRVTPD